MTTLQGNHAEPAGEPQTTPADASPSHCSRGDLWLERARAIGDRLLAAARTTPSGGLTWVGPRGYGTEFNPLRLVQLNGDIYDGVGGIALFFAYLAKAAGDEASEEACRRSLAPIRRWLNEKRRTSREDAAVLPRVGGLMGIGSLIYTLQRSSELLGDQELHQEAVALTEMLTAERIAGDLQGRIQTGCAGTILALLALPPAARGASLRQILRACAERLLELRVDAGEGAAGWPLSPGKPSLLGFGYGAAGVGHALGRVAHELGEPRYREAADQADAFLRRHYSPELDGFFDPRLLFQHGRQPRGRTWRDWWASGHPDDLDYSPAQAAAHRPGREDLVTSTCCHGSPGIAAMRLAVLEREDRPEFRRQIETGLRTAANGAGEGASDLCCGEAGRVDLLLFAARRLGDEQLRRKADENLALLLERADREGRFLLSAARGRDVFAPTLFQGLAGVGYVLARAAAPELPCLLVME